MQKQAVVRRVAGLAVAAALALCTASAGFAQTTGPYQPPSNNAALKKCLKKAKKKSTAKARSKAKKKCHKKF
jgi:hypothetical protein